MMSALPSWLPSSTHTTSYDRPAPAMMCSISAKRIGRLSASL